MLPPGMEQLPEPGQAVVSPKLDQLASHHRRLDRRYPHRLVLGSSGVRSGEELFAYIRIPRNRSLALSGDEPMRVGRFGASRDIGFFDAFAYSSAPLFAYLEGVGALLVVPGLVLLVVGVTVGSGMRDRRFEVLRWIGAKRTTLSALCAVETMILALPGVIFATMVWGAVAPRLGRLPLVRRNVVNGDLALSLPVLVTGAVIALALSGVAAVLTMTFRRQGERRLRPEIGYVRLRPWRGAVLGVGLLALILGAFGIGPAANLSLLGVAAIFAGVPLVLPILIRRIGTWMARLSSVPAFLAGRRLSWNPLRATRPLLGVATLIVVSMAGFGAIAKGTHPEGAVHTQGKISSVSVKWVDPHVGDTQHLADALGTGLVVPIRLPEHNHNHDGYVQSSGMAQHRHARAHDKGAHNSRNHAHAHGHKLTLGATCPRLASYLFRGGCEAGAQFELPESLERQVKHATLLGGPSSEVSLVPRNDVANTGHVLVFGHVSLKTLEARVRTSAMATLPASYVTSPLGAVTQRSPLIPWIVGGIVAAILILACGCLLSLVTRLRSGLNRDRHLLAVGVTPVRYACMEASWFGVTYLVATAASFLVGLAVCALIVGVDVPMPWPSIRAAVGMALLAGFVGITSMFVFGLRGIDRTPR